MKLSSVHRFQSRTAPRTSRVARSARVAIRAISEVPTMSTDEIKGALLDSFYGTERGLAARSEVRADISELITQLEARSPVSATVEDLDKLSGKWRLAYTSNSELLAVLALGKLPGLVVGDITQNIDGISNTVENKVELEFPLSKTAVSTTASYEVRSPKRLQIQFNKGAIATPQLLDDIELPTSIPLPTGGNIDLAPFLPILSPVQSAVRSGLSALKSLVQALPQQAELPIQGAQGATWLITTYLDGELRISRGDGGSVFILVKEMPTPILPETPYGNTLELEAQNGQGSTA